MNSKLNWIASAVVVSGMGASIADAATFVDVSLFAGTPDTTGEQFDELATPGTATHAVLEEKGAGEYLETTALNITIASPTTSAKINVTTTSLGIDRTGVTTGDDTDALDGSEEVSFSFNLDTSVLEFDFDNFDDGESIKYQVGAGATQTITYADLTNNVNDYITLATPIALSAGTTLRFFDTTTTNGIGFDEIRVQVPEPASLGLLAIAGLAAVGRRRGNR